MTALAILAPERLSRFRGERRRRGVEGVYWHLLRIMNPENVYKSV